MKKQPVDCEEQFPEGDKQRIGSESCTILYIQHLERVYMVFPRVTHKNTGTNYGGITQSQRDVNCNKQRAFINTVAATRSDFNEVKKIIKQTTLVYTLACKQFDFLSKTMRRRVKSPEGIGISYIQTFSKDCLIS